MSLQFVFGNSGAGKSRYLYENVIKEAMQHPKRNYIVLVPEQFTMQTQKELVKMHPNHGIMNIDVLGFGRLAHRIFEEVGGNQKLLLDDMGKNLIIRKAASGHEKELPVFGKNLRRLGYVSEVKSVISELMQYDIGLEELEALMEMLDGHSYLFYKMKDIAKMYQRFLDFLQDKYMTGEELLDRLCDVVVRSEILKDSVVVLDEFTGFTPVQHRLIGRLLKVCSRVSVAVTMDENENPYSYRTPYQLFALGKQTTVKLTQIAKEQRVEIEDPVCLYQNPKNRFSQNPALGFLEKELFRYHNAEFREEQDTISIWCANNPREECAFTAAKMRELVRTKGYRYRDMAVITGDMSGYEDYLERAFEEYEIPVFMDYKRSILLNPFVEYFRSLLAMAEGGFTYEQVFRFLRTGLSEMTDDEIDGLENYVKALGIRGFKKWQEPWIRHTASMGADYLAEMNRLRAGLVEKLDDFMFVIRQRKKTVQDITMALYQFFVQEGLQKKLKEQELRFQKMGEPSLAKEYAQVYRVVIEVLEQLAELLGEEEVSIKEYSELLDAALEEAKIGIIPPSVDQVVAGDIERTRLNGIKVLFMLGINDTILPGSLLKGGILTEQNREELKQMKMTLTPGVKEQAYIQKYYLYLNLTKPSGQLYLCYSAVSSEGKSIRPAYLIADVKKLYPKLTIRQTKDILLREKEISRHQGIGELIQGFHTVPKQEEAWKELYAWYARHPEWSEKIGKLLDAAFMVKPQCKISETTAKSLYGELKDISATRLERFSACAFSHFMTYGLCLKEREEYQFRALDFGNLFHRAIEYYSKKLVERGISWTEIEEERRQQLIDESVEESIVDYGNTILYSSARNEYLVTRLKQMLRRTVWALTRQLERGVFVPDAYEVKFGGGKIDRVDICETEDKVYVKVMDYKTGSKSFDMTACYHGLQLQLAIYLSAALAIEKKRYPNKEIIPAGIFYYQIKDPIVAKEFDKEKLEQAILKELRLDGIVNAKEEVLVRMDGAMSGSSDVIPVGRKKDGSLTKASKAVKEEAFGVLEKYTEKISGDIKQRMVSGEADAAPYEYGTATGCDYCKYNHICGFDTRISGCEYRKLEKYELEEVLAKMKGEVQS